MVKAHILSANVVLYQPEKIVARTKFVPNHFGEDIYNNCSGKLDLTEKDLGRKKNRLHSLHCGARYFNSICYLCRFTLFASGG